MKDVYRIILADDHVIFRQGMKALIEEAPGLEVAGEAGDGFELLNLLNVVKPDLVILDISMPGLQGIEATREIKKLHPDLIVLILTMHKNKEFLYHAISAGARGYLLKEDSDVELFSAIEAIRKGAIYVSAIIADEVSEDFSYLTKGNRHFSSNLLSKRETEVLKLIAEGKSNKEIADLLYISIRTVENHRANIQKKLDLNNTAELVRYAIQRGISELSM